MDNVLENFDADLQTAEPKNRQFRDAERLEVGKKAVVEMQ